MELPKDGNCFTAIMDPVSTDPAAETSCSQNTKGPRDSADGSADLTQLAETLCSSDILVTNSMREFQRIPDLLVENWVKTRSTNCSAIIAG
jgi:hypothetical protein